MEGQVGVRIKAKTKIAYGEELLVCGSVPQLGSWKLSDAALMQCQGDVWSLATRLPCGVRVELKLVKRPQGGQVHWHGGGPGGNANLVLETSIGRVGAQGSRFLSLEGFPWHLEVEDLDPEEAAGLQPENSTSGPDPVAAPPPNPNPGTALATPGSVVSQSQAQPVPMEALLAGHAAAAGHAVTYTTTTTTTTAVTINGASPGGFASPAGPPIEYTPQVSAQNPTSPTGSPPTNGTDGPPRTEKALPPPEPTEEDMKAMVAARQLNIGIPRAGPLPLQWNSSCARDVRVRGSWDGWKRDYALEPCPGVGYRIMLLLPAGEYEFKFIVDGTWTTSDEMEQTKCNNRNNVATVNEMVLVPVPLTKVDAVAEGKLDAIESGALAIEA